MKSESETKWLKLIKIEFIKKKDRNVRALDSGFSFAASFFFLFYSALSFANTVTHGTRKGLKGNQNKDHMGWIFT